MAVEGGDNDNADGDGILMSGFCCDNDEEEEDEDAAAGGNKESNEENKMGGSNVVRLCCSSSKEGKIGADDRRGSLLLVLSCWPRIGDDFSLLVCCCWVFIFFDRSQPTSALRWRFKASSRENDRSHLEHT